MQRTKLAGGLCRGISRMRATAILTTSLGLTLTVGAPGVLYSQTANTATVTLTPANATVAAGSATAYYAAVSGSASQTLTWFVDGIAMGNSTVGTLVQSGNAAHMTYTAPAGGGTHTIRTVATNASGVSVSGSTTVTVQGSATTSTANTATVTLSPAAATVAAGSSTAYYSAVSGSASQTLTWFVDGVAMGNATVGTLVQGVNAANMTYKAPTAGGTHTIKTVATNSSGASVSGSTTVTVQAAATTTTGTNTATVTLSPANATVATGSATAYYAAVSGSASQNLTWFVDGVAMGNSTVGVLSANGNAAHMLYTAPASGGTHTITTVATNSSNASVSGATMVTVAGTSTPAPVVSVSVTPSTASLYTGAGASFTASVSGSTNTAVTWTVDGVAGGNATVGTLSGTGSTVTYTAPATAGSHTVKATSTASTTASASAAVTVLAQPQAVSVTLNPSSSATVSCSGTRAFTATVSGTTNTAVTWSVDGVAGGNTSCGTISGTGTSVTYTAPSATGTHTVAATSASNTSVSASTVVTIQPASAISVTMSHIGPSYMPVNGGTLFTATVTGSTNTSVVWSVDGVTNGNATVGTIYAPVAGNTVIYKSPAGTGQHVITATSTVDGSKSASTTMNVAATIVQTASIPVRANVRNAPYNATGNGSTDDTAAIQAAVNAVAGTGGAVVVPPGTYLINPCYSGSAGIRLGSNMTFIIQPGAVLRCISTSTQVYNMVICSSVHDVNITGGGLVLGNNLNNTIPTPTMVEGGDCITVVNSSNIVIEGLFTQSGWDDGIYVGSKSNNVVVNNVDCSLHRRNGMSITDGQNIVVTNSTFHNNLGSVEQSGGGIINGSGLDVEANAGESISTLLFYRNSFNDNYYFGLAWGIGFGTAPGSTTGDVFVTENVSSRNKRGMDMENCPNSVVTNNVCDSNSSFGIYCHDGATNSLIRGNTVTNTGSGGDGGAIELYNESYTIVDANTVTNSKVYGCLVVDSISPTITNNNFSGSGTQAIRTSNVSGGTISGNTP